MDSARPDVTRIAGQQRYTAGTTFFAFGTKAELAFVCNWLANGRGTEEDARPAGRVRHRDAYRPPGQGYGRAA